MNIQARKLEAIEYLIHIHDEKLLEKIEAVINDSYLEGNRNYKKFTNEELIDRANEANQDYIAGRIVLQEDL